MANERGDAIPAEELSGTRVLVVDDQEDTRELVGSLLSAFGASVSTACSGNEAFRVFEREHPDVVVSDVQMPDGDGLELIKRIRSLHPDAGALTPAIAVTGAARSDECMDAGFHFHFMKPLSARTLVHAIRCFVAGEEREERSWSLDVIDDVIGVRWQGRATGADMRAMTRALGQALEANATTTRVVIDLRELWSFTPAVASVAQRALWELRAKLSEVVVVGSSPIRRALVDVCKMMDVPCSCADEPPGMTS